MNAYLHISNITVHRSTYVSAYVDMHDFLYQLNYLHCTLYRSDLQSPLVLELGAGCGLVGLTVARLPGVNTLVFSDYDPGSCKLIEENIELNKDDMSCKNCIVESLTWGDVTKAKSLVDTYGEFPLVFGSDLIYCKDVIAPLLITVSQVLYAGGLFVLASSFDIGAESKETFNKQAKQIGLSITDIKPLSDGMSLQYITKETIFDTIYDQMVQQNPKG